MSKLLRLIPNSSQNAGTKRATVSMRLGVSYNLFDGEELLENSIRCIREKADYISVVYQTVSNYGHACSDDLIDTLNRLKSIGLVDELQLYTPKMFSRDKNNASYNELEKRNVGLNMSRRNNCTHHMSMDCDEFYVPEQFEYMKATIVEGDYDSAVCHYTNYYNDSIYKIDAPYDAAYVSTIYKINDDTAYKFRSKNSPVKIDPTRKTNNNNYIVFDPLKVEMHHMNMVRKNLRKKYMSSTYNKHGFKALEAAISCYDRWEYPEPGMSPHGELFSLVKTDQIFSEFPFVIERRNNMVVNLDHPLKKSTDQTG